METVHILRFTDVVYNTAKPHTIEQTNLMIYIHDVTALILDIETI